MIVLTGFLAPAALTAALNAAHVPAYGPQSHDKPAYARLGHDDQGKTPQTPEPGAIRPASYMTRSTDNDRNGRAYVCADHDCKMTTPAYNSRTPLDEEQGRVARD